MTQDLHCEHQAWFHDYRLLICRLRLGHPESRQRSFQLSDCEVAWDATFPKTMLVLHLPSFHQMLEGTPRAKLQTV